MAIRLLLIGRERRIGPVKRDRAKEEQTVRASNPATT